MWEYVYKYLLPVYLLELSAALAGSYYLHKGGHVKPETKVLVYYLWLIVFVELVGFYPLYAFFTNYETLPFIKDTPWERNFWWYNLYHLVKFAALYYYFIRQLTSSGKRKIFSYIGATYLCCSMFYLIFSGEFFYQNSTFDAIVGTFLLMILILYYYSELLRSDKILVFYKNLPFFVSMGILVWHLVVTPLFIYNIYFTTKSPEFVELHSQVLSIANFFLYGMFIAGFLVCAHKRKDTEDLVRS